MGPESMARHLGKPDIRLAYGNSPPERNGTSGLESPTVQLVGQGGGGSNTGSIARAPAPKQIIREEGLAGGLAHKVNHQGDRTLEEGDTSGNLNLPALLVSFFYLEPFLKNRHRYCYRDWVLDSGAFSAHNSGATIELQKYIDCCKELMTTDPTLVEIYSLDVIGDWKASLQNTEEMWRQGVPAIPCFHYGESWDLLKALAAEYPKVAIGGCVGKRDKDKFAGQCFSRTWPKRLHGFGFGSEKSVMMYPWHSVDATNWEIGPCKYGRWNAFGGRLSVRGSQQNLRAEVEWYLELERKARNRWKEKMRQLDDKESALTVRLAVEASARAGQETSPFLQKKTPRSGLYED